MRLQHITFTGIDAKTDIQALKEIQREFPIAEFGVLTSYHWYENGNRYLDPRILRHEVMGNGLHLSLHICGSAASDAVRGRYADIFHLTYGCYCRIPRIQLNVAGRKDNPHVASATDWGHEVIVQQRDPDNLDLFAATLETWKDYLGKCSILLDASGGRGINTPLKVLPLTCKVGYAGGINPENVGDKLDFLMREHTSGPFWIDMESGVRTNDWFDIDKVIKVLKICQPIIQQYSWKELPHNKSLLKSSNKDY
jgi:hypothetical protein